jgi:hypothetical protein
VFQNEIWQPLTNQKTAKETGAATGLIGSPQSAVLRGRCVTVAPGISATGTVEPAQQNFTNNRLNVARNQSKEVSNAQKTSFSNIAHPIVYQKEFL